MGDTAVPTPYSQFSFFKSLSFSLYEYDWYNFMEQWQAMVAVNAPIPELSHNLEPFFTNAKRLLPVFHRYMGHVRKDPEFLNTLTTVLMSTPLLIKVQEILRSQILFSKYVAALKMDNPSASHNQVMQAIQTFLAELPNPTRLAVQRAFIEAEASDSMGLSSSTLETAFHILHSDTQLYIDVLTTMQLNQTRNMPWEIVVSKVKTLVNAKKPYAWVGMDQFLKHLHWGHYQEQQSNYDAYGDEGDYAEYGYEYGDEYEYGGDDDTIRKVEDAEVGEVLDGFAKLTVADRSRTVAT
ncbi:hypothetical protein BG011_008011 [Mortierella polycephala]|uniref:Uncharacterized protein n=1 Tax=Mortierella polycephala TaxID=41804 RepID=A0A9P6QCS1_9FUNG|nr:hypothetical protein BG011_008011 [Mortierella polycephala]